MNAVITPDTPTTALSPLHLPLQGGLTLIEASAGTGTIPTATVALDAGDGKRHHDAATGGGPVEADSTGPFCWERDREI